MSMEEEIRCHPELPPGFRFHPTDEELLIHYLKNKLCSSPLPLSIIADVDLYKFDPWDLPGMARFGEQEWYFFSPRERKYPNGARPNRAAASGYWKATGTDKPVVISGTSHKVGVKKALVFYKGKPPKGIKTSWIMHEYRLTDTTAPAPKKKGSSRLDDWVLCRIYKKASHFPLRLEGSEGEDSMADSVQPPPSALPKFESCCGLGLMQREDLNFVDGFLDTSEAAKDLVSSRLNSLKRNLSLAFDNEDEGDGHHLLSPNSKRHMYQYNNPPQFHKATVDGPPTTLSDFQQVYSLPILENRIWNTETPPSVFASAWLS